MHTVQILKALVISAKCFMLVWNSFCAVGLLTPDKRIGAIIVDIMLACLLSSIFSVFYEQAF